MGGNYEKNMYNQLCELMAKVDSLEADHKENRKEIRRLNNEISSLNNENRKLRGTIDKQNQELTELNSKYSRLREENRVLRNDNERREYSAMTAITLQNRLHLINPGSQSLPIAIIHVRRPNVLSVPKVGIKVRLYPKMKLKH